MSRIGKIFGRKDDQSSENEEGVSGQGFPESSTDNAGRNDQPTQSVQELSDQDFGLKFIFTSGEGKTFTSLPISIGRDEQNDIILDDETVSANHACVDYDQRLRDICILDNGSLNGVFIDDQPTHKNILYDGVCIRLGDVELTFRDTGYIHSG